jgi:hypothetical protein
MKKLNKGGATFHQNIISPNQLLSFNFNEDKIPIQYQKPVAMTSNKPLQHKQKKKINISAEIYRDYIKLKNNYREIYETNKIPVRNYNTIIKYIRDYKYYKNKLSYTKSSIISLSKFKTNLIKSRINDYFNINDFFTSNIKLFENFEDKKRSKKSSSKSTSSSSLFDSSSTISGGKKKSRKIKKGGGLKDDGKEFLSIMHILDSKHDFYDNVSADTKAYMNELYENALTSVTNVTRKNELRNLFSSVNATTTKDKYYEENILVEVVTKISKGKFIEDINDFGNFQFIDVNDDSTKFIYYPTIDESKVQTENNTDNDTIIKNIRNYFDYDNNINNYKYMYDTKIFINNEISQVLANKNTTVFSKIATQCKPFENGYDPHPSNEIIIEDSDYINFKQITDVNFNSPESADEYNYATRNIVRRYINFTIIKDENITKIPSNKYLPAIIFKNMANIPAEIENQYTDALKKIIKIKEDCCYYKTLTIPDITGALTTYNNIIIYTKSFNEKPKVRDYVETLVQLLKKPPATRTNDINDYIELLLTNLKATLIQEDFVLRFVIIHCFYSNTTVGNIENKIRDIINILFDLKKSGDWGQSLFCSKYNLKYPTKDCFFISGDKLSAARSIMEGNVKTVTATDYNSVFNTTDKGIEKRAVLTLYRNGELMTFKYFITFLERNILKFVAFKHMKIDFRYFINPTYRNGIRDTDLITDANFNFIFFHYFMIIIIYQLRIFYNTYTIIDLKTSEKIPGIDARYYDFFYDNFIQQLALLSTAEQNIMRKYINFPIGGSRNILTFYLNENIFEMIDTIIIENPDKNKILSIIGIYLKIIDDFYDSPSRPEKAKFEELDKILITDIFRIVDTNLNTNLKVNNISNDDTSDIIYQKYQDYYTTNTKFISSNDNYKYFIINKFFYLLETTPNDFSKCKNLIYTISSYNNICSMLLIDEDYNDPNFIDNILILSRNGNIPKANQILKMEQETEIKTMINVFKEKILEFIDIISRYFTDIGRFVDLSHDLLLDIHENNLKDHIYLQENIDTILNETNNYLPEEQQKAFIFSYFSYGTIIHSKIQYFEQISTDFVDKIRFIWANYPELNLETKHTNKTLSDIEEKIYKDFTKFIAPPIDPTKTKKRKAKSAPNAVQPSSSAAPANKKPAPPAAPVIAAIGPPAPVVPLSAPVAAILNSKKQKPTVTPAAPAAPAPSAIASVSRSGRKNTQNPNVAALFTAIRAKKNAPMAAMGPPAPVIIAPVAVMGPPAPVVPLSAPVAAILNSKKRKPTAPPATPAPPTVQPIIVSRSGRQIKVKTTGGARRKNGENRNKLSFRLYSYFVSYILSYYNYHLCVTMNPAIQANKDDIIKSFITNILLNSKLINIVCVTNRITFYNEILLFRILYINNIIKTENINLSLKTESSLKIIRDLENFIFNISKSPDDLFQNTEFMDTIDESILTIIQNNENINKMFGTLLNITTYSLPINPISEICSKVDNIKNIIQYNNIIIQLFNNLDFSNTARILNNTKQMIISYEDIFKTNNYYSYYTEIYLKNITRTSNIKNKIASIVVTINDLKVRNTNFSDIDVIMTLIFTYALYMYLLLIDSKEIKTSLTTPLNATDINNIKIKLFEIIKIKEDFYKYIDPILDNKSSDPVINQAIEVASLTIEYNFYSIKMMYLYVISFHIFNNIQNNNNLLSQYITEISKHINNSKFIKKENIFLTLYNKQNDIQENINKLYTNHAEFKANKEQGKIALLIQDEVYPRNIKTLFVRKDNKKPGDVQQARPRAAPISAVSRSRRGGPIQLNLGESAARKKKRGDEEEDDEDDNQIEISSAPAATGTGESKQLNPSKVNELYNSLVRKAAEIKGKPNEIDFTKKALADIYKEYFDNIKNVGTKIITAEKGQGAETAITGANYNENIIIQNIIFITIIANHFKEIVEYKGKQIFDIINTIDKDNTYKIHSFITSEKSNYYNNDDYKIITLVYACLYNIIKIKHEALIREKTAGRDKYNFIGYYNKKNKYDDLEKLFSMFDLVSEITKIKPDTLPNKNKKLKQ